jgi:hypothetical protein
MVSKIRSRLCFSRVIVIVIVIYEAQDKIDAKTPVRSFQLYCILLCCSNGVILHNIIICSALSL